MSMCVFPVLELVIVYSTLLYNMPLLPSTIPQLWLSQCLPHSPLDYYILFLTFFQVVMFFLNFPTTCTIMQWSHSSSSLTVITHCLLHCPLTDPLTVSQSCLIINIIPHNPASLLWFCPLSLSSRAVLNVCHSSLFSHSPPSFSLTVISHCPPSLIFLTVLTVISLYPLSLRAFTVLPHCQSKLSSITVLPLCPP